MQKTACELYLRQCRRRRRCCWRHWRLSGSRLATVTDGCVRYLSMTSRDPEFETVRPRAHSCAWICKCCRPAPFLSFSKRPWSPSHGCVYRMSKCTTTTTGYSAACRGCRSTPQIRIRGASGCSRGSSWFGIRAKRRKTKGGRFCHMRRIAMS